MPDPDISAEGPEDRAGEGREGSRAARGRIAQRVMAVLLIAAAIGTIFYTNHWLTERFSENTRVRAELRAALYTGNLLSELQRTAVVPLLLARDPNLISSLMGQDFSTTSARLMSAQKDIGAASIRLLDGSGRTCLLYTSPSPRDS